MGRLFQISSNWRLLLYSSLLLIVPLSLGCDSSPPVGSVSGTVVFNGEPVPGCRVVIRNPETKHIRGILVDEQGAFEIKEVLYGEYEVAVKQVLDPHEPGHLSLIHI